MNKAGKSKEARKKMSIARQKYLKKNPYYVWNKNKNAKRWTVKEIKLLRKLYKNCPNEELATIFNRSYNAVICMAKKHNLKRSKTFIHKLYSKLSKGRKMPPEAIKKLEYGI